MKGRWMSNAYALLGLTFLIVFAAAYVLVDRAHAPVLEEESEDPVITNTTPMSLTLSSPAFKNGETIPSRYTCDGENGNPELRIEGVPEGTVSLVLVMDDPDIPDVVKESRGIEKFNHWVLYNIPPETTVIEAGKGDTSGTVGVITSGGARYTGPCPPDREHRYFFRLYALSGSLNFIQAPTLDEVESAANGMMIESAELMGRYERVVQ